MSDKHKPALWKFNSLEHLFAVRTTHLDNGCQIWNSALTDKGYGKCGNYKLAKENKAHASHVLSYLHHYGEYDRRLFVLHKCHNRACHNPEHLYLGTHQDNMDDMVRTKRQNKARGEKQGSSKLTELQAKIIKYSIGEIPAKQLAEDFNISVGHVNKIRSGSKWAWL